MQFLETPDPAEIKKLIKQNEFFWLDLHDPSAAELDEAGELFGLHELAIEDSREFGQRPKLERYESHALIVFYGVQGDELVEVHLHVSGDWVVTVHRKGCAALKTAYRRMSVAETRTVMGRSSGHTSRTASKTSRGKRRRFSRDPP